MVIKPANLDDRATPIINRRNLDLKHLLLLLIASTLVHGLGLLIFSLHQRTSVVEREPESKPIDFVVVPEESEAEPPSETQKRAIENSVAEEEIEPEVEPEETATAPTPPAPPPVEPAPPSTPPTPKPSPPPQPAPEPEPPPATPQPEPEPAPEPTLSGSDAPIAAEAESEPDSVATLTPPPEETAPEAGSAEDLLGGSYQKTLANGGGDTFFSPEALEYNAVLSPQELKLLKGFDLEGYQRRLYNRVKRNWQPSFSQRYTTWLTFNIEKNGQISQLQVIDSSGSTEFDRIAVEAVRNATPFEPLPSDFPLEHLKFKYQFYLY